MKRLTTIADVAKRAGVSRVAASAVVNGARTSARVSAETRDRVLNAANELRYIPNAAAQSLTRPGMSLFGVAFNRPEFSFLSNPYVTSVLEGILAGATDADFNVTLFNKPWVNATQSAAPYANGRMDGLIIIAPFLGSDMVPELAAMRLPLVLVSATAEIWGVPAVSVDNERGGRMAAEHLLELGHRRIGFVSGGDDLVADARDRRKGFLGALTEAGVPVPDAYIARGDFNWMDGYAAAQKILSHPERPTAIFAANDFSALGAMQAALDLGISVPEQLSIIGFDDIADAGASSPPLTTVRSPSLAMGRQAAELLIACVSGEPVAPKTYLLEPEFVRRESTAPAPTLSSPRDTLTV